MSATRTSAVENNNNNTANNIMVCVRVRPIAQTERINQRAFECVRVVDQKRLLLVDPDKFSTDPLRQNRAQEREFHFDAVFGPTATESEVQELLGAEGLVDSLVRLGRNGTVLAYGPTGTGKTHTMVGTRERPGLMTGMIGALYARLEEMGDHDTRVYISFMELYNELIRDLLSQERGAPLDLMEDERGNVHVPSLSRIRVPNIGRIMQLLQEGNARRTQEPTAANATSSRSHALLQISLWRGQQERGKLFLIDLAGSERASHTQNQGQRLKEGAAINRSLLALGNVINALSAPTNGRRTFVNFRDSKLTRLLKDSLAGAAEGARTVLITHCTPSSLHYDETFNTLTYASRARRIDLRLSHNRPRRPASADRSYSEALASLRRDAQKAGRLDMGHAASTGKLSEMAADNGTNVNGNGNPPPPPPPPLPRLSPPTIPPLFLDSPANTNRQRSKSYAPAAAAQRQQQQQQQAVKLPRIGGTSLFESLREQYLSAAERQQRLRDRLLRANMEAYDLEVTAKAKLAILEAYQRREELKGEDAQGDGEIVEIQKVAEKMRKEMEEQERRLAELGENRQKMETALRRGEQNMRNVESRMRGLARNAQDQQVIDLIRSLAQQQAERAAIQSDFAIQDRRLRRQESQLKRLRRYERVADRLITSRENLNDEQNANLFREYRMLRSQLSKLAPIESGLPSWNSQILNANGIHNNSNNNRNERRNSDTLGNFGKTFVVQRNGK